VVGASVAGSASAPLDPQTTNTGNPGHRQDGPTVDPSTLPPDDGTGTGHGSGSGHYSGITPDQTGDGADLNQGLGVDRGPTVNLGDNRFDLRGLRLGDGEPPLRAVAGADGSSVDSRAWSANRPGADQLDHVDPAGAAAVDPTRFEIQDPMGQPAVGGDEFEAPELPWDADPTGVPGLVREGVDSLGITPPGTPGRTPPTAGSITSSIPSFDGPGRDGGLSLTIPGAARPVVPGADTPVFQRGPIGGENSSTPLPESQQPDADDDPYEVRDPGGIDVEPGDDYADERRDDESGAHLAIGHPDTSELDMFDVAGGAVFDVRITNTGNPANRPEGPSFDPSTLPPDDGTRVGRATGDEDEMEDLDIQRRTVDDDGSGGVLPIGHPDTSDMFDVVGGAAFDVQTTNTGNPGLRPEGPSFDPSTLPPDDGTRVGRDTGDEDEMDDLDLQRRTVDGDEGTPGQSGGGDYGEMTPDQIGGGPDLSQGLGIDRGPTVNLGSGVDPGAVIVGATNLSQVTVDAGAAEFAPAADIADPSAVDVAVDFSFEPALADPGSQAWLHGTHDVATDPVVDVGSEYPGDDMIGP
jgi:hypothetical protein